MTYKYSQITKEIVKAWYKEHPLYRRWHGMKTRCENKIAPLYKFYGAKGVKVCEEWHNYQTFVDWALTNGYEPKLQLDRINPAGDYCPDNCRFLTPKQNQRNRRHHVKYYGLLASEIYEEHKEIAAVCFNTFNNRIRKLGWDPIDALFTPPTRKGRPKSSTMMGVAA